MQDVELKEVFPGNFWLHFAGPESKSYLDIGRKRPRLDMVYPSEKCPTDVFSDAGVTTFNPEISIPYFLNKSPNDILYSLNRKISLEYSPLAFISVLFQGQIQHLTSFLMNRTWSSCQSSILKL